MTVLDIKIDDLTGPEVQALILEHLKGMSELSPPESMHALNIDGLKSPKVTFWSAWDQGHLAGCGAMKELDSEHGEIKSMRTSSTHLRKGVAKQLLEHKQYLTELETLMDTIDSKCAILCSSDVYALEVLKWLKARKIRVPDQVGLMGFDNIEFLKYINPSLTTVDYNVNEIGTKLADLLIRRINDDEVPAETLIDHHVLQGESVMLYTD